MSRKIFLSHSFGSCQDRSCLNSKSSLPPVTINICNPSSQCYLFSTGEDIIFHFWETPYLEQFFCIIKFFIELEQFKIKAKKRLIFSNLFYKYNNVWEKFQIDLRENISVYDEHPISGWDIQCRAPISQSRYTAPFDDIIMKYVTIYRNARPNNNQLIAYYPRVGYLLRIQQYPVNNTYNRIKRYLLIRGDKTKKIS